MKFKTNVWVYVCMWVRTCVAKNEIGVWEPHETEYAAINSNLSNMWNGGASCHANIFLWHPNKYHTKTQKA